jgi:hypothetical protein
MSNFAAVIDCVESCDRHPFSSGKLLIKGEPVETGSELYPNRRMDLDTWDLFSAELAEWLAPEKLNFDPPCMSDVLPEDRAEFRAMYMAYIARSNAARSGAGWVAYNAADLFILWAWGARRVGGARAEDYAFLSQVIRERFANEIAAYEAAVKEADALRDKFWDFHLGAWARCRASEEYHAEKAEVIRQVCG